MLCSLLEKSVEAHPRVVDHPKSHRCVSKRTISREIISYRQYYCSSSTSVDIHSVILCNEHLLYVCMYIHICGESALIHIYTLPTLAFLRECACIVTLEPLARLLKI